LKARILLEKHKNGLKVLMLEVFNWIIATISPKKFKTPAQINIWDDF
jgi:hypothetical protein